MKLTTNDFYILENHLEELLHKNDGYINSKQILRSIPLLKNDSNVRKCINHMRQRCIPIISTTSGYKISFDDGEIIVYLNSLNLRIKEMQKAYNGIKRFMSIS